MTWPWVGLGAGLGGRRLRVLHPSFPWNYGWRTQSLDDVIDFFLAQAVFSLKSLMEKIWRLEELWAEEAACPFFDIIREMVDK
jgi:hypothetical protein